MIRHSRGFFELLLQIACVSVACGLFGWLLRFQEQPEFGVRPREVAAIFGLFRIVGDQGAAGFSGPRETRVRLGRVLGKNENSAPVRTRPAPRRAEYVGNDGNSAASSCSTARHDRISRDGVRVALHFDERHGEVFVRSRQQVAPRLVTQFFVARLRPVRSGNQCRDLPKRTSPHHRNAFFADRACPGFRARPPGRHHILVVGELLREFSGSLPAHAVYRGFGLVVIAARPDNTPRHCRDCTFSAQRPGRCGPRRGFPPTLLRRANLTFRPLDLVVFVNSAASDS